MRVLSIEELIKEELNYIHSLENDLVNLAFTDKIKRLSTIKERKNILKKYKSEIRNILIEDLLN